MTTIKEVLEMLLVVLISKSQEANFEKDSDPEKVILLEDVFQTIKEFEKEYKEDDP